MWNGKEALEYLLKATSNELTPEQSKAYPLPSLVLMDVQMPVLDGYNATHLLRHHAPFTGIEALARIPIVAMTASAIHGDREKCERAGMDDYMAKPVKRVTLEKTILKWVTSGRPVSTGESERPSIERSATDQSSNCNQHDLQAAEFLARSSPPPLTTLNQGDSNMASEEAFARRSSFSRSLINTEIPGGESEGDRAVRRAEAEDKARALRDAKLFHATERGQTLPMASLEEEPGIIPGGPKITLDASQLLSNTDTSPVALTMENVSRFNLAQEGSADIPLRPVSPSVSSNGVMRPLSDIPGPPPDDLLSTTGMTRIDADAEALVESLLTTAQYSAIPSNPSTSSGIQAPSKSRKELGGLSTADRQKSDWSTSTARPEH